MKTFSKLVCSIVVLGVVVLHSTAEAQQIGKGRGGFGGGGGFFGTTNCVSVAANESVQKELAVSDELKEKLNSLRDDLNAARQKEYQVATINPQDFQNLSAEQRQKMNQIGTKLNEEFD